MRGRYQYPLRARNLAGSAALIAALWGLPWVFWPTAPPAAARRAAAPLRVAYRGIA